MGIAIDNKKNEACGSTAFFLSAVPMQSGISLTHQKWFLVTFWQQKVTRGNPLNFRYRHSR